MAVESRVRGTIVNCVLGGSYPLVDVAKHLVSHQVHVTVVWLIEVIGYLRVCLRSEVVHDTLKGRT